MIFATVLSIVVYGPTQYGKSTFIKRLGGSVPESALGNSDGRSQTKVPSIYNFNITWPGESTSQQVSAIDLPGMDDTDMAISNSAIGQALGVFTAQRDVQEVSAFLVFCSLGESSTQMKRILRELSLAAGDVTSSVVVIMSKADLADKISKNMKTAMWKDCEKYGVKCVEWTDMADKETMRQQLVNLKTAISQVSPYPMQDMSQLEQKVEARALYLREHDHDRYTVRPKERDEESRKSFNTIEELKREAKRLQEEGPEDYPKVKVVDKPQKIGAVLVLLFRRTGDQWDLIDLDILYLEESMKDIFLKYGRRPIDMYNLGLIDSEKIMTLEEKYPFEHYLELAREQLVKKVWNKVTNKK